MRIKIGGTDVCVYTMCFCIVFGFAIAAALSGCETWRGMGKDTKNLTQGTANTVDNVFGGGNRRY